MSSTLYANRHECIGNIVVSRAGPITLFPLAQLPKRSVSESRRLTLNLPLLYHAFRAEYQRE